jgi:hypothetical protein
VTDLGAFGPVLGGPPTPTDLATLRLVVDQQRGLVTRQQCLAAGITYRAVRHRLDTGRWTRLRHGVYLTVPGREGWWWQATSALLSVGSGAAWAFGTAGFAHGLVRTAPTTVELVVDAAIHVRPGLGIRVHRSRYADQRVDELHWPWRTRFEETVLDLAERGSTDEVLVLLGRAFFRGQTTEATLRSLLENRARHLWRRLLTDVLADVADGARSAMEVRFLQDVERAHGLPRGRRQAPSVGADCGCTTSPTTSSGSSPSWTAGWDTSVRDGYLTAGETDAAPDRVGSPCAPSGSTWLGPLPDSWRGGRGLEGPRVARQPGSVPSPGLHHATWG